MSNINLDVVGTKVTLEPITAQTFSLTVPSAVPAVITALATGPQGPGVPFGGATNDLLVKKSATSFDTAWQDTVTLDVVGFDTAAGETVGVGQLAWNPTDGTLDLGMLGGNVTQQIGMEQYIYAKNPNNTGITEGLVYYLAGATGGNKEVLPARADSASTCKTTIGVATESANGGAKAFITTFGLVRGLPNSLFTDVVEGSVVYLSATQAGRFTSTRPAAPNHSVVVGYCVRKQSNNNELFVRTQTGLDVDELCDVDASSPADGDVLTFDGVSGTWRNEPVPADSVISVNGQQGTVVLDAGDVGAYPAGNPDGFVTAAGAAAAAPVQSVNGSVGTVVITAGDLGAYLDSNPDGFVDAAGAAAAAPVQSVNGLSGTVVLDAAAVGAYPDSNPSNYIDASGAPVQSVNGAAGTVVLTTSDVAEGTALYYTDVRAAAAAPVQSVNSLSGTVVLDAAAVGAVGTATGLWVYDYGTAIPSSRPVSAAVYWRGTAVPGTAISLPGDLWYDTTGD